LRTANKTIDLISVLEDTTYCLKQTGNGPDQTDTIRTKPCDSSIPSFAYLYDDDCSTTDYADVDCCDDANCTKGETCQKTNYKCLAQAPDIDVAPSARVPKDFPDWPFALIVSHGTWCLDAKNGVANGDDLGLQPCDFVNPQDTQLFLLDKDGKIRSKKDTDQCLTVGNGVDAVRGGARIKFLSCDDLVTYNIFEHDKTIDLITIVQDPTYCLQQTGNGPDKTDTIRAERCDDADTPLHEYFNVDCSPTDYADVDCCEDNDCLGGSTCDVNYKCI